jgi:signal transduction histidine kinase
MVASWGATYSRAMIEAVRDRLFHPRVVADAAAAAACAVALPVAQAAGLARGDPGDYVATAALVVLPLALRRFVPTFVALVAAAGIIATAGRLEAVDLAAFAVVSFSMADTILSRRRSLASLVVIAGGIGLWFALNGSLYAIGLGYAVTLPAWIAGDWWRERRARKTALAEAEALDREARVRQAVLDERRRLARELHDVVAHDVGVMVVQAGGARQILEASPARARDAMTAVEATGREALSELRRLLDLLADDRELATDLAPHPALADIDAMIVRLREAGLPVELRIEGLAPAVPDWLGAAAYRIVQEALTNAMKHSRGAPTRVVVRYEADAVSVEVTDDGPGPQPTSATVGRGLVGMRERAESLGGTLEVGPRADGGYRVHARLPIEPAECGS